LSASVQVITLERLTTMTDNMLMKTGASIPPNSLEQVPLPLEVGPPYCGPRIWGAL